MFKLGQIDVLKTFFRTPGPEVQNRLQSRFSGMYGNPKYDVFSIYTTSARLGKIKGGGLYLL
jgi:hypothetical protein